MIYINTLDTAYPDLSRHEQIARILANELPELALLSEPLDIVHSLEKLSDEMLYMPEIIQDCRLASEAFERLDDTIDRMYALADRASELPNENDDQRQLLNEEFNAYAHILARLAGADDFDGPSLSLSTEAEARATRAVLAYLNNTRRSFTRKLNDQRRQINEAMEEALAMIFRILNESDDLSATNRERLTTIWEHLSVFINDFMEDHKTNQPQHLLH